MGGTTYAEVIGPLLLGGLFGSFLAGFGVHQCVLYFTRYKHDHWLCKLLVLLITAISLLSFGGHISDLWWDAIVTRGDDAKLRLSTKSGPIAVGAPVFASTLTQSFFAARAYLLYRSWILGGVLTILVLGSLGTGLAALIYDVLHPILAGVNHSMQELALLTHLIEAWLWTSAGVDVVITFALMFRLAKDRKGFNPRTDTIIRRLLLLTVSTGLLTSTYATVDAIVVYTTSSTSNALVGMSAILPHLYAVVTIGSLNLRNSITAVGDTNNTNNSRAYSSTSQTGMKMGPSTNSGTGTGREYGVETIGTRRGRYELGELGNSLSYEKERDVEIGGPVPHNPIHHVNVESLTAISFQGARRDDNFVHPAKLGEAR